MMHGPEKSDPAIVAMKPANKAEGPSAARPAGETHVAESAEPRVGTKGNADARNTRRTQGRERVSQALARVRKAANVSLWRQSPEVGAVCGKAARTDLCGGREIKLASLPLQRRDFIALVGAVLWPVAAQAQQPDKKWRIGYLTTRNYPNDLSESFLGGLRTLGYVEGKNLIVKGRAGEGNNERLPALATALIDKGVDIIVTEGTPATKAAMQSTTTVPIVFGTAQDPVEKGIVASLARPGGNVTGNALIADHAKPLQILKEAAPGLSRIAFIYDPATRPGVYGEASLRALKENARTLGITVQPISLRSADEIDQAFAALAAETNGLLIENSALNLLLRERICQFAVARRLPAVGTFSEFAHAGCFLSYGEDNKDLYRRAASYVDKILKGAKPSDLPVNQATTFALLVNLKTAKALGLEVPPSVLAGAAEVIE